MHTFSCAVRSDTWWTVDTSSQNLCAFFKFAGGISRFRCQHRGHVGATLGHTLGNVGTTDAAGSPSHPRVNQQYDDDADVLRCEILARERDQLVINFWLNLVMFIYFNIWDSSLALPLQNSVHVTLWFKCWHTHTVPQYLATLAFLFLLACFQEYLAAFRLQLGKGASPTSNTCAGEYTPLHNL